MKKLKTPLLILVFVVSIVISMQIRIFDGAPAEVYADENLVSYALSWRLNPNIPYIYGGERNTSLEEIAATEGKGTDCSGFVRLVYLHFGVDIPGTSSTMFASDKGTHITDIADALPGDVCYWDGHVALYLGQGKIIHTNTRHPGATGRNHLIHVSIVDAELAGTDTDAEDNYRFPECFIRFLDTDDVLRGDSPIGDVTGEDTQHQVEIAIASGSLVTESDLTGLSTEWSLEDEQRRINLSGLGDMSLGDQKEVIGIKESIKDRKSTTENIISVASMVIGVGLVLYALLVCMFLLLDKANTLVSFSFLSLVSLGRWVLADGNDVEDTTKHVLTTGQIIFRVVVIVALGFIFISGLAYKWVYWLIGLFM